MRLLGDRVALDAFEFVEGAPGALSVSGARGYGTGFIRAHGQMVPRIRRLLAQQHLKTEPHMPGLHTADFLCAGASPGATMRMADY